jgi:NitT/TauT family transport system substrate-binding protein
MKRSIEIILTIGMILLLTAGCGSKQSDEVTLRFGVLPVLQALDVFYAEDMSLFTDVGITVELIPFNTATEKDLALSTGQIDGCFADLFTPIVLAGNGVELDIVAVNYDTREDRHMFAVLGGPGKAFSSMSDLANIPVAISSNSVIHHVTETLIHDAGVPEDQFTTLEAKNIGLRMQMLMSGQVVAATLPEPLASAAVAGGATLLADDRGLAASKTVFVFRDEFIAQHKKIVHKFLAATEEAHKRIADDPESARSSMVTHVRLPESMQQTYPVPIFPSLHAPDQTIIDEVEAWLIKKGSLDNEIPYTDLVNDVSSN